MQWKSSLYLTGGMGYAVGSLLLLLCVMLQPVGSDPALMTTFMWKATTVGFFFSAAFILTGAWVLQRHFINTDADGWAILALALSVVGPMGYLCSGLNSWAYAANSANPNAVWMMVAFGAAGRILAWASMIPMGLALTRERRLPSWLGAASILLGAVEVVADVVMDGASKNLQMVWFVGFAYLFVLGVMLIMSRDKLAAATEPTRAAVTV